MECRDKMCKFVKGNKSDDFGLTPLGLDGQEGLVSIFPDHFLDLVQQDRHAAVFAGCLTVQDVVIIPAVLQQSLQLATAPQDVLLDGGATQPVAAAEQHHGVEAGAVTEQRLDVGEERPPLPGRQRRHHGEDQQQCVRARPQKGGASLRLLPDAFGRPAHREPIPARSVHDGDPAARHQRLPPEAQLRLLARLEVAAAQDGVPHRALPDPLPAQQKQPQLWVGGVGGLR